MSFLFHFATRRPRIVLLLAALVAVVAALGVSRLENEEDLLVFLPTGDADVRLFEDASRRFGSLRVALVGVEAPAGDDVFSARSLLKIKNATRAIKDAGGVDLMLSLTEVADIVAGPLGAQLVDLVPSIPRNEEEHRALRERVLSREFAVGNFVSRDGRAALIMAFLADGKTEKARGHAAAPRVEERVRAVALRELDGMRVFFGGAPFAARAIYEEAQADVRRLSPVALVVLLLVVVLAFRDPVGVALTVGSVAFSVLVVLGGMGLWGERFTVASATLPVILFASGSSYAVHVLGRYYLLRADRGAAEAITESLGIVGPPLAIAAGTTAVGFYSFVTTDVRPMRAFGIACGSGVLLCWLTSLTVVPAVVTLWPRRHQKELPLGSIGDALVGLWRFSQRHRRSVFAGAMLLGVLAVGPMLRVKVRMEPRAFFRPGSEPWLAERFLDCHFGGADFAQIWLSGDFSDPSTLREVARTADFARSLPGVTQVATVLLPLRLATQAMDGLPVLPWKRAQAANLFLFLDGQPGMGQLITPDREHVLLQVRISGDAARALAPLEAFVKSELRSAPAPPTLPDVAERLSYLCQAAGHLRGKRDLEVVLTPLADGASERDLGWQKRKAEVIAEVQKSEEAEFLDTRLDEERRRFFTARALPVVMQAGQLGAENKAEVAAILDDLFVRIAPAERARRPLSGRVAGGPVLDRGFSRSVGDNQARSLVVSIAVVLLLMFALFRSLRLALLSMWPSLLTMAVMFGAMGISNVPIDLGTSLVAGIATGAGSDFAMHYLWYLRSQSPEEVSRSVGPVMVIAIFLVSLGFIVLALGRSPVMHLFGALAGLSMSLSAFLTCLLVPAVLKDATRSSAGRTRA